MVMESHFVVVCVRTRGSLREIFVGGVAVHSLTKALTDFWLDAFHVSRATAG